jgi:hypothetical protein
MPRCMRATVASLVCLCASAATRADPYSYEQFVGEYVNVSTSQSREKIDEAIDEATAPMGFLSRTFAKKQLEEVNTAYATIRITQRGELLTTRFAGWPYVSAVDGSFMRNTDPDGRAVDVSYAVEGNVLHARYVGTAGEKRFDLIAAERNQTIEVRIAVLSKRIPRPVRYTLSYVKVI